MCALLILLHFHFYLFYFYFFIFLFKMACNMLGRSKSPALLFFSCFFFEAIFFLWLSTSASRHLFTSGLNESLAVFLSSNRLWVISSCGQLSKCTKWLEFLCMYHHFLMLMQCTAGTWHSWKLVACVCMNECVNRDRKLKKDELNWKALAYEITLMLRQVCQIVDGAFSLQIFDTSLNHTS